MIFQIAFFVIGLIVATPVLLYFYFKNPNPRFRPRLGEMVMLAGFALLVCAGLSHFLGGMLDSPEIRGSLPTSGTDDQSMEQASFREAQDQLRPKEFKKAPSSKPDNN